jgi:hypothetical protein
MGRLYQGSKRPASQSCAEGVCVRDRSGRQGDRPGVPVTGEAVLGIDFGDPEDVATTEATAADERPGNGALTMSV